MKTNDFPRQTLGPTFFDASIKLPTLFASSSTMTTCGLISRITFSTNWSKKSNSSARGRSHDLSVRIEHYKS